MRLKKLVVIAVSGLVLTGAATAATEKAAAGPSVDQAFTVCAPQWPGVMNNRRIDRAST